jgi:hypothetical protein
MPDMGCRAIGWMDVFIIFYQTHFYLSEQYERYEYPPFKYCTQRDGVHAANLCAGRVDCPLFWRRRTTGLPFRTADGDDVLATYLKLTVDMRKVGWAWRRHVETVQFRKARIVKP